mgnify:FL=1
MPADGWENIATRSDIASLQAQFSNLNNWMKVLFSTFIGFDVAIIVLIAQLR